MAEINWTLLTRYAAGDCSAEERAEVERQLTEVGPYPEGLAAIDWVATHAGAQVSPERRAALHGELRRKIAGDRRTLNTMLPVKRAFKIAAAVLIAVGLALTGSLTLRRAADSVATPAGEPGGRTIATTRGQRLSLRLPDGTLVVLAPASTLRLASTYGGRDRAVQLEGQAAFTVVHDERRPFVVRAGDLIAEDLGTEFAVRAYPGGTPAEVVVREGVVAISAATGPARGTATNVSPVHPGERGRLSATGAPIVEATNAALEFAWTEGRLVFQGTPLSEAMAQLERWYDIEIRLASSDLATRGVSGSVIEQRPPARAVEMIAAVLGLQAVQTGPRSYTIRAP